MSDSITIRTPGRGLHEITDLVRGVVARAMGAWAPGAVGAGTALGLGVADRSALCTVFVRHTSASLLIQENADPSARRDLEAWLDRLVPEGDGLYTHRAEGADDMPAHVRSMLTAVSLGIPIVRGELALGAWLGIYLWEHRRRPHSREVVVHVGA